ncbi:COQ9 family protein [Sphingomonas sp. BIUV-7]|uniref:COQ9 family protein n=1 Tax=Sphingomonas natans TaxID=3063330 RepID=A0ABT8YD94_9SPHN|nr:COQ9 family protein [Sphingomonas sp. BIUV-7]MDO6416319.1 COQ9 family protein [Sphingomonas sp. BIUV-7]
MTDSAIPPLDMTLDELRAALGPLLPQEAAFDGWSEAALSAAAMALGVPPERARLAIPGGAIDMIEAWFASVDAEMVVVLPSERLAAMKIRERITAIVLARLEIATPHREALRRAIAILALPTNVPTATRLGWHAADAMWRLAGDTATGFAHYTKRATLGAVYLSTILVFLDDESEGFADTRAFLDRRIAGVMRFEKLKAQLKPDPDRHFSPARFLGRLRYRTR